MSNIARKHHYRSELYLKGFTPSGIKGSQLTAIDVLQARVFTPTTDGVGSKRDFNRMDVDGLPPDVLESMLSGVESKVADAITQLEAGKAFDGEIKNAILNMVALFAVRSPRWRRFWAELQETFARQKLGDALSSRETWEGAAQRMRAKGIPIPAVDYQGLKDYYEKHQHDFKTTREANIRIEFVIAEALVPNLWEREWLVFESTDDTGPFITGDHPVCLNWTNVAEVPFLLRGSPGYGMPETRVTFPITKRLAVIGEFDGHEGRAQATRPLVAAMNGYTFRNTHEQLYAPSMNFSVQINNDVLDGVQMVKWLKQRRSSDGGGKKDLKS